MSSDDIVDDEIYGRICNQRYPLSEMKFAGKFVTVTGAQYPAMKLLLSVLLKMDFTITAIPNGEPSVVFSNDIKMLNR